MSVVLPVVDKRVISPFLIMLQYYLDTASTTQLNPTPLNPRWFRSPCNLVPEESMRAHFMMRRKPVLQS
jgi:hypothetical protein